jgi:membrane AbrB-like protein
VTTQSGGKPGRDEPPVVTAKAPKTFGLDPRQLGRLLLGFAIAGAGSITFTWLHLPLPIFLGALAFAMIAALLNVPYERPKLLSVPMRAVLGIAVGSAFTPALMGGVGGMVGSLALVVPYAVLLTVIGMLFFERLAGLDRTTAFYCSVPGGLSDMVTMAADSGANQRVVTLVHATRIAFLVFAVPFFVQIAIGQSLGGRFPNIVHLWEVRLVDALVLIALGVVGYYGGTWMRIAGAALIGPMIVSAVVHMAGLTAAKAPFEVLALAQITLGILLGDQFRGLKWSELTSTLAWALGFSGLLLVLTVITMFAVSALTGFERLPVLLAFAPGGQTELNLLALILNVDVAFVALHHLIRLAVVILGAQLVFAVSKGRRRSDRD